MHAFCRVLKNKSGTRWSLLLLGDGPLLIELEDTARGLGIDSEVEFRGSVFNVSSDLNTSDMFVLPSRAEGLSNALLEAMACGLPCIATRIGGNVELIENYENG